MIAKMTKDFKKFKRTMQLMVILGAGSIVVSRQIPVDTYKGLLAGFGTSLLLIGSLNMLIILIKSRNNSDFEKDLEIEFADERLQANKMKGLAYAGIVGMMALAFSNMFHLIWDVDLLFTNILIVMIYVVIILGFKVYYKNK